ncbi:ADP compounds hydrolase NudE [Wenzhouxiangella marina]|uniref:Adenosine nucleotide hydrolase NudE n=1 Tax=Wenzhouxiangella marina TaxID=1579979 RepID=A0A0K0XTD3_9GAMM|nr:ADP compounds hydrolase NudE [Wenzhouxiangella marina]AKS40948.1 Adenosine nucleotide hydrolase NudE [Wenzhouxiangella marina]MBB6087822.1 ADP-ribose diphosphatase [Wenzhouxiangella marina]
MDSDNERKLPIIHARRERRPADLFKVEQLDLEFSNGERRTYERLLSRGLGAVIIVAMPDEDHVLLVREYACGVHRYELGLPKGRLEPGESLLEGANRELQEECGFAARELRELGQLTLAPGYMTHATHVVLARDLYPSRLPGDEPEELEVLRWPLDRLVDLVEREDCSEGRTIAALYMARDLARRS